MYLLIAIGLWSWRGWGKIFKVSLKVVDADLRRRLFCSLGHEWYVQRGGEIVSQTCWENDLSNIVPLGSSWFLELNMCKCYTFSLFSFFLCIKWVLNRKSRPFCSLQVGGVQPKIFSNSLIDHTLQSVSQLRYLSLFLYALTYIDFLLLQCLKGIVLDIHICQSSQLHAWMQNFLCVCWHTGCTGQR